MNPLVKKYGKERRWLNWKILKVKGRDTKIPYRTNGLKASVTEESDWSTYEGAKGSSSKIGIVFKPNQRLVGIDIDDCLNGKTIVHERGKEIKKFVERAKTYTEVSPSKTGLHLFLEVNEPFEPVANRKGSFEIYSKARYFTFTGESFGKLKNVRSVDLKELTNLLKIIGYPREKDDTEKVQPSSVSTEIQTVSIGDIDLLSKAFKSKNGSRLKQLYEGDISAYQNDYSVADMALCGHLAFWTGKDKNQMERIWLTSPLGSREKTRLRADYRTRTIINATSKCTEVYKGPAPKVLKTDDLSNLGLKKSYQKDAAGTSYKIAQKLVEEFGVKTIDQSKKELYVYQNGIYTPGENFLNAKIQLILEDYASISCKKEIIAKIKDLTLIDREAFNKVERKLINLNNGVLNVETLELFPHTPDYLFFSKFPVSFVPGVECTMTKDFLSQILTKEDIPVVQEWIGYCLYRKYFIKKAMIFVGEPNTGKTTLLNVIRNLMGSENVSGVSLQRISSDKFSAAHLYNKHINIFDDLAFKDVNDNGGFKIATGGGMITGEYKFGNQFNFESYSKLTFATNKIPNVKDTDDEAYFSRWIIIHFNNQVTKANNFLASELSSERELSGLLNFALEGLNRILKEGNFSYGKSADDIKDEMLRSGSPIAHFAYDCIAESSGNWISKDDLYNAYAHFVKSKGLPLVTAIDFGRKITHYANYIIDSKKDSKTGWRNVEILGTNSAENMESAELLEDFFDLDNAQNIDYRDDLDYMESENL